MLLLSLMMAAAVSSAPADPKLVTALQPYMKDGQLDVPALQAALAASAQDLGAAGAPAKADRAVAETASPPPPGATRTRPQFTAPHLYLRDSFADVALFESPSSAAGAKGAAISYSHDAVKHDSSWALKGVLIAPFAISGDYGGFLGLTAAPYLSVNRETHSTASVADKETFGYGLAAESGWQAGALYNYGRISAAGVDDRVKRQTDLQVTGEYIPVVANDAGAGLCIGTPCRVGGLSLLYALHPELVMRYDRAPSGKVSPFSDRREAWLIGPQATLNLHPFGPGVSDLSRLHLQVTYRWLEETRSHGKFTWLDTALGYNLDAEGRVALTGVYSRGDDEDTALFTKTYKISLTGKF